MSKIVYHGHSFIEINHNGNVIFIDPFIEGNPFCDIKLNDSVCNSCNYIILTHGHFDHLGSTLAIAKDKDVEVIAVDELSGYVYNKGVKVHGMNIGGSFQFPFGRVKFTIAHHTSSTPEGNYAGEPAGLILNIGDKTIYHAGDTALFYDMKLIGEMNKIDYAFLPIGDTYTMGVDDAVKAAEFLNANLIIPIHYNTFDQIKADENDFKRKVESVGKKCVVMNAGDELNY